MRSSIKREQSHQNELKQKSQLLSWRVKLQFLKDDNDEDIVEPERKGRLKETLFVYILLINSDDFLTTSVVAKYPRRKGGEEERESGVWEGVVKS